MCESVATSVLSLDHAALWVMLPERLIVLQKVNNSRAETPLTAAGGMRYAQALGNRTTLPTSVTVFYLSICNYGSHQYLQIAMLLSKQLTQAVIYSLPYYWDDEGQSEKTRSSR